MRRNVLLVLTIIFLCLLVKCYGKRAEVNKIYRDNRIDEDSEIIALQKKLHKLQQLSKRASKKLSNLNDYETFYTTYLKNLLRVRVPGTVGHHAVKEFIIKTLKQYKWNVRLDEFVTETPLGQKRFTNIIATLNSTAGKTLAFAAHYDSKLMEPKDGKYFIAATDSAVPCGMLLDMANILSKQLKDFVKMDKEVAPMLIFLDGEEAFVKWDKNDSLYGARHLAEVFASEPHSKRSSVTTLQSMEAFVLLDLIGAKNPTFYNFFSATSQLYQYLQNIELGLHKSGDINNERPYFVGSPSSRIYLEDDHLPFMEKGVPILHLIPVPFPKEWHTLDDDVSALDTNVIENLLKIFRHFVMEYFHLVID